jgi:hypothetical protein
MTYHHANLIDMGSVKQAKRSLAAIVLSDTTTANSTLKGNDIAKSVAPDFVGTGP